MLRKFLVVSTKSMSQMGGRDLAIHLRTLRNHKNIYRIFLWLWNEIVREKKIGGYYGER